MARATDRGNRPRGPHRRALRLTFEYEGDRVELVSRQDVEMVLPASDPLEPEEDQTGFWYVVSDEGGRPLYRRQMQNPIQFDREVFSEGPDQTLARQPVADIRGQFVLLVPDIEEGAVLSLVGPPPSLEALARPVGEIARFDLRTTQGRSGT